LRIWRGLERIAITVTNSRGKNPCGATREYIMFTEYKAAFHGIKTPYVNPFKTSRRSPNGERLSFINYRYVMLGNVITSRDVIASWNIALRGLKKLKRMRGSWVKLSPDSPRNEAMKTRAKRGNPEARKIYPQIFTVN